MMGRKRSSGRGGITFMRRNVHSVERREGLKKSLYRGGGGGKILPLYDKSTSSLRGVTPPEKRALKRETFPYSFYRIFYSTKKGKEEKPEGMTFNIHSKGGRQSSPSLGE